jgi:hypothetical protein
MIHRFNIDNKLAGARPGWGSGSGERYYPQL